MATLEAILERNNMNRAYKQGKANKGGSGVDGMTVDDLLDYLRTHAVEIVESVKAEKYTPELRSSLRNFESRNEYGYKPCIKRRFQNAETLQSRNQKNSS